LPRAPSPSFREAARRARGGRRPSAPAMLASRPAMLAYEHLVSILLLLLLLLLLGSRPPRRGPPARITLPVRRHPRLRLHWAGGARFSAGGRAEVACSTAHLECGLFCRCVCACADARAVTLFHHPVADSQPLVRVVVEV
ncbi:unnamed protein product, partial [Prorocentrum cordatum]